MSITCTIGNIFCIVQLNHKDTSHTITRPPSAATGNGKKPHGVELQTWSVQQRRRCHVKTCHISTREACRKKRSLSYMSEHLAVLEKCNCMDMMVCQIWLTNWKKINTYCNHRSYSCAYNWCHFVNPHSSVWILISEL